MVCEGSCNTDSKLITEEEVNELHSQLQGEKELLAKEVGICSLLVVNQELSLP